MFVKERVAAMKKLEDAREKARMAAELSKKGKTMASGNALNTSSSDRHTTDSSASIPEVSPPMTVRTVIRVGPREGDHIVGKSATYSGSTGGRLHNSDLSNPRKSSFALSRSSPSYGSDWQVDAMRTNATATAATTGIRPPSNSSRRPEHIASAGGQSRSDRSAPPPSQTPSSALYMMEPVPLMNTVLSSGRYALNSPNQLSSELDDRKIRKKIDRLTKENKEMQEKLSSHHKVMELVVKKLTDIQAELQSMKLGSLSDLPENFNAQSVFKDVADSCDSSMEDSAEERPALLIADLQEHVVSLEAQLQLLTLDMKDEGQSLCCFTFY